MIRTVTEADVPALAALNAAEVPAVGPLDEDGMRTHVARCAVALAVDRGEGPVAFLLALEPGADYGSENYRWFSTHRPGSLYVDRIVVGPHAQRQGWGRRLYAAVADHARAAGIAEVTCEVNLDPPNPRSLAFHDSIGFHRVGELTTNGGAIRVALLAAPTAVLAPPS